MDEEKLQRIEEKIKTLENRLLNLLMIAPAVKDMVDLFTDLASSQGYEIILIDGKHLLKKVTVKTKKARK